jgi:hypothetical protein
MFCGLEVDEFPKEILTHNPKMMKDGRPQLNGAINILFKRTEQATHGLIHEDDNVTF